MIKTKNKVNPIEEAVDALLEKFGVKHSAYHMGFHGIGFDGKPWEHDKWNILFQLPWRYKTAELPYRPEITQCFEFSTGVGLRRKEILLKWQVTCRHEAKTFPVSPKAASVLYSLVIDSEALDQSFSNWCANFGYNDDSMSAHDTYRACCDNARKLHLVFTHEQIAELKEAVQEY